MYGQNPYHSPLWWLFYRSPSMLWEKLSTQPHTRTGLPNMADLAKCKQRAEGWRWISEAMNIESSRLSSSAFQPIEKRVKTSLTKTELEICMRYRSSCKIKYMSCCRVFLSVDTFVAFSFKSVFPSEIHRPGWRTIRTIRKYKLKWMLLFFRSVRAGLTSSACDWTCLIFTALSLRFKSERV